MSSGDLFSGSLPRRLRVPCRLVKACTGSKYAPFTLSGSKICLGMVVGTRNPKCWVLGTSGHDTELHFRSTWLFLVGGTRTPEDHLDALVLRCNLKNLSMLMGPPYL